MTNEIKSKVVGTAKSGAPWKKGVPWWLVLIEGIALVGVGLYMFFAKPSTMIILGWVIALTLVAGGAFSLYLAMRATEQTPSRQFTLYHGIAGVAAGGIAILLQLLNILSDTVAAMILGLGCLIYGGMGLYTLINKDLASLRRVSIIGSVALALVGVLLLLQAFGMGTFASTVQIITLVILIAGIGLILWSLALKNSAKAVSPANAAG